MKSLNTLLLAGALACAATSWAVPAKRVQHIVTQPDGSQVTLTLVGDEFCHYYVTDDSQAVVSDGGAFYFAKAGTDGRLVASNVLASNVDARTASQNAYLQTLGKDEISNAIEVSRNLSPLKAAVASRSMAAEDVSGLGLNLSRNHPTSGSVRALCVLVQFSDIKFMQSTEETLAYFTNMLTEEGFSDKGATGSAYDYFVTASMGKFTPQFDVAGPYTLPHPRSYYGGNNAYGDDKNAVGMVEDMADIMVAEGFDFSPYDNDHNGVVDNVFVFYAGVGEAQSGVEESVWPHQFLLSSKYFPRKGKKVGEGLYLDSYACSSELNDRAGTTLDGIGTFVHEYSHVLGLPDLYHTKNNLANFTPGKYSVLDAGPYNNDSRTPPIYSSYERNALGWIEPVKVEYGMDLALQNLETSNSCYVITTDSPNEFFLLENRQKQGWDTYIPGHGMLVWHIDYNQSVFNSNIVNNDESHQYVDIIEAGGRVSSSAFVLPTYTFPGSSKVTSLQYPMLKTWAGEDLGLPITEIAENDGLITATVGGTNSIASSVADSQLQVEINGSTITVLGVDAASVTIYDGMGRIASRAAATATLAPGIYVVATPQGTAKVAIK